MSATPPANAPRLEPGRELGPVRLVREIGRGATGAVFQGHHTVLGRDVAVKFLVNVVAGPGDGEGLRRFVDEARAAASVRHPNLTQIFHADLDGAIPYLVLEYVRGPTVRTLLDYAGRLSMPATAAVMSDVAAAVAELHARGIIHRDIKPSNVLVDPDGRVFVTDFGLALRRSHAAGQGAATGEAHFSGTPAYMAGEMFEGRVSARSDVYAMGVMAYQLMTGSPPFSGTVLELREKHLREPLPCEPLRACGARPEVVEVIERATNKQAMFRYKTAPDFARALRDSAACDVPTLARGRKQLCDLVAARGAAGAGGAAGGVAGTAAGPRAGVLPPLGSGDDDSGSSLYTETLSRIATSKRERRRQPLSDGDGSSATGSSTTLSAPPRPVRSTDSGAGAGAGRSDAVSPAAAVPSAAPRRDVRATKDEYGLPPVTLPPAALSTSVLSMIYGTLAAVWQAGVLLGAGNIAAPLPAASRQSVGLYSTLVPAAVAHLLITATFVAAGVASLGARPWARRLLVILSVADLAVQVIVLVAALQWVEAAYRALWVIQCVGLSVFPAFALTVMARRDVKAAFEAAAAARPDPDAEDAGPPLF